MIDSKTGRSSSIASLGRFFEGKFAGGSYCWSSGYSGSGTVSVSGSGAGVFFDLLILDLAVLVPFLVVFDFLPVVLDGLSSSAVASTSLAGGIGGAELVVVLEEVLVERVFFVRPPRAGFFTAYWKKEQSSDLR